MSVIFGLLILLGVLFSAIIILGYFLPDRWQVEKAVIVNASEEDIFPLINSLKNWQEWSAWNSENNIDFEFKGPESGVNATQLWNGNQINGKMKISKSIPFNTIEFNLELEKEKFLVKGIIVLEATMPSYTQVAWRSELNMAKNNNPVFRWQAFFLKNYFDTKMNKSLQNLQALFESSDNAIDSVMED
jgi:hypothetical protein